MRGSLLAEGVMETALVVGLTEVPAGGVGDSAVLGVPIALEVALGLGVGVRPRVGEPDAEGVAGGEVLSSV